MLRFIGWMGVAVIVIAGCEGKHRYYETTSQQALPSDMSTEAGASEGQSVSDREQPPNDLALDPLGDADGALGEACTGSSDCLSGFCVDGVCCRSACDTVCSRCDAPGTEGDCSVSANDAACSLSCPESTDCRSYGSGALTANCEAVGLCRMLADCRATDAPVGTVCGQGDGSCDGQGECIVAGKKRLGEACADDAECGQGNCVIGSGGAAICCDAECSGLCQTCGASGRCNETPRDDARCSGVDCPEDNLCRDYVADLGVNLCRDFAQCRTQADCTFTELRPGAQCSCGSGGCALTTGSTCSTAGECTSGVCDATPAGGKVCCAQGCSARGLSCAADGSRCVQCDVDGAECQDNVSRVCADGALSSQTCGNGCDAAARCNAQRPTGSVCDGAAQCQSGVCTLDVTGTQRCCDASCAASGRACGADGTCVCPAGTEAVGGSCRLRAGQACAQASDCASGACVGKVSGGRVCCAQGCNGSFCAADGSGCVECEGEASSCQGNTAGQCEDGTLIESQCGNGCNTATGVCNGLLPNGQNCTASGQCASTLCAADLNGTQRCCTPNCAATGRVCGGNGACVCASPSQVFVGGACRSVEGQACGADGDCRSNACEATQGGARVCCSGNCNSQICRASGQGCVACEGNASTCQGNNSRSCVNNAFVTTTCATGCNASTGSCNSLIQRGGTGCSSNTQCFGNGASCQSGRCCEFNCQAAGRTCDSAGICQCPSNTVPIGNACLLANGIECTRAADCASGSCNRWYVDLDFDLHGDPQQPVSFCGIAGELPVRGFVASNDDCCDRNPDVFTGQTSLFSTPQVACPGVLAFDYNCNGLAEGDDGTGACNSVSDCRSGWASEVPACGGPGQLTICAIATVISGPPGTTPTQRCVPGGGPGARPVRRCN